MREGKWGAKREERKVRKGNKNESERREEKGREDKKENYKENAS